VHAATITVTNTNDSGPGSLRQTLAGANDGDTINFAVSGDITLTSGGLLIDKNVLILGPGANQLSIDGDQMDIVFGVDPDRTVAISGLTIRNGQGGIGNVGALTVSDCVISGNSFGGLSNVANGQTSTNATLTIANSIISDNSGPGVTNFAFKGQATLAIANSTLTGNSVGAGSPGGGVFTSGLDGGASVTVSNSTIRGNSADGGAGVFSSSSFLTIVNSTVSGNSASESGGGIYNDEYGGFGPVVIANSTISGNSARISGGGIYNVRAGYLVIANSTLSGNSAGSGGGIYNDQQPFATPLVQIYSTILNAGPSGENIFNNGGTVSSFGYNLSSDDDGGYLNGPGDQINTDPLLGPLQNNGGPTFTHALSPHSPAINAGDPNFTPPPFYDQRGSPFVRVFSGRIDIGSFEEQPRHPTPHPRPTPP
jgi:hypothetical protein